MNGFGEIKGDIRRGGKCCHAEKWLVIGTFQSIFTYLSYVSRGGEWCNASVIVQSFGDCELRYVGGGNWLVIGNWSMGSGQVRPIRGFHTWGVLEPTVQIYGIWCPVTTRWFPDYRRQWRTCTMFQLSTFNTCMTSPTTSYESPLISPNPCPCQTTSVL